MTKPRLTDERIRYLIDNYAGPMNHRDGECVECDVGTGLEELLERRAAVEPTPPLTIEEACARLPEGDKLLEKIRAAEKSACEHEWRLVSGQLDAQGEFYIDRCTHCNKERQRRVAPL